MQIITVVFLLALVAGLLLQLWLIARQAAHIIAHRDSVPDAFDASIELSEHRRAASYSLARLAADRWDLALAAVMVVVWTLGGGLGWLEVATSQLVSDPLWSGVLLILATLLISGLIELPLSAWRTFGIEQRFGFNRTTPGRFLTDRMLGALLAVLLGAPLSAAFLWLMTSAGGLWWLWAWLVWMAFSLFITWAYPTLIAPLFNRFEPLGDPQLRQRLESLLQRCGFRSNGMFVMDGSRRSAHGNAYFTGFGSNKRIVFFDTLLEGLDPNEVEAVLAHELGHYKLRHVVKRLLASAVTALLGLGLLGWLSAQDWFYSGLGVDHASPALALALFLLILPVFGVFFSPLTAYFSRRHEYEADDFAADQTDARFLISGLVKMYRDNASTLTPDPLYSAFYHSHPPAPLRIAHLSSKLA